MQMVREKELKLLSFFRNNSRTSLTKMSRDAKMPVSKIFDKLKEYENNNLITKHTSIIDFKKLGFDVKSQMLIYSSKDDRNKIQDFLIKHPKVNTVFRINNGYDFLIEAIFKNMLELDEFSKQLEQFKIIEKKEFFVMEDVKREEFLTNKNNLGIQL